MSWNQLCFGFCFTVTDNILADDRPTLTHNSLQHMEHQWLNVVMAADFICLVTFRHVRQQCYLFAKEKQNKHSQHTTIMNKSSVPLAPQMASYGMTIKHFPLANYQFIIKMATLTLLSICMLMPNGCGYHYAQLHKMCSGMCILLAQVRSFVYLIKKKKIK